MQKGPSYSSSAAMKPENSESAQSRWAVRPCRAAFFPPGLDPILDRGVGDEHAVVAPQGPSGGAVGQAVLDDQADGSVDDPVGVVTAGVGQVGHVGVEVPAALRAEVPGVEHNEVAGPTGEGVAEVVEGATAPAIVSPVQYFLQSPKETGAELPGVGSVRLVGRSDEDDRVDSPAAARHRRATATGPGPADLPTALGGPLER